jgi:Uma2 family endonuclease
MTVTLAKWTIAQYHQMIASGVLDDVRVELLNGEIVTMPSEGAAHAPGCFSRSVDRFR